ncbi:S-adenosylmethionine synthetase [Croceibacter atlanticus HTCC2559]|uniref:S-adenosylmethionine synthetase n=1 Tax=Croceibacter atlanticus (strain ATCC BAA-628 / JCM 21780 / CIP 108009 / IAM 15332 / KCTC 12090 / HTCC2559) TaxID=216432 RepID=A3U7R6_CROAH|nr:S-adenosylmethionine synthetase [Croceibacter atlanticus HTCC2559]
MINDLYKNRKNHLFIQMVFKSLNKIELKG